MSSNQKLSQLSVKDRIKALNNPQQSSTNEIIKCNDDTTNTNTNTKEINNDATNNLPDSCTNETKLEKTSIGVRSQRLGSHTVEPNASSKYSSPTVGESHDSYLKCTDINKTPKLGRKSRSSTPNNNNIQSTTIKRVYSNTESRDDGMEDINNTTTNTIATSTTKNTATEINNHQRLLSLWRSRSPYSPTTTPSRGKVHTKHVGTSTTANTTLTNTKTNTNDRIADSTLPNNNNNTTTIKKIISFESRKGPSSIIQSTANKYSHLSSHNRNADGGQQKQLQQRCREADTLYTENESLHTQKPPPSNTISMPTLKTSKENITRDNNNKQTITGVFPPWWKTKNTPNRKRSNSNSPALDSIANSNNSPSSSISSKTPSEISVASSSDKNISIECGSSAFGAFPQMNNNNDSFNRNILQYEDASSIFRKSGVRDAVFKSKSITALPPKIVPSKYVVQDGKDLPFIKKCSSGRSSTTTITTVEDDANFTPIHSNRIPHDYNSIDDNYANSAFRTTELKNNSNRNKMDDLTTTTSIITSSSQQPQYQKSHKPTPISIQTTSYNNNNNNKVGKIRLPTTFLSQQQQQQGKQTIPQKEKKEGIIILKTAMHVSSGFTASTKQQQERQDGKKNIPRTQKKENNVICGRSSTITVEDDASATPAHSNIIRQDYNNDDDDDTCTDSAFRATDSNSNNNRNKMDDPTAATSIITSPSQQTQQYQKSYKPSPISMQTTSYNNNKVGKLRLPSTFLSQQEQQQQEEKQTIPQKQKQENNMILKTSLHACSGFTASTKQEQQEGKQNIPQTQKKEKDVICGRSSTTTISTVKDDASVIPAHSNIIRQDYNNDDDDDTCTNSAFRTTESNNKSNRNKMDNPTATTSIITSSSQQPQYQMSHKPSPTSMQTTSHNNNNNNKVGKLRLPSIFLSSQQEEGKQAIPQTQTQKQENNVILKTSLHACSGFTASTKQQHERKKKIPQTQKKEHNVILKTSLHTSSGFTASTKQQQEEVKQNIPQTHKKENYLILKTSSSASSGFTASTTVSEEDDKDADSAVQENSEENNSVNDYDVEEEDRSTSDFHQLLDILDEHDIDIDHVIDEIMMDDNDDSYKNNDVATDHAIVNNNKEENHQEFSPYPSYDSMENQYYNSNKDEEEEETISSSIISDILLEALSVSFDPQEDDTFSDIVATNLQQNQNQNQNLLPLTTVSMDKIAHLKARVQEKRLQRRARRGMDPLVLQPSPSLDSNQVIDSTDEQVMVVDGIAIHDVKEPSVNVANTGTSTDTVIYNDNDHGSNTMLIDESTISDPSSIETRITSNINPKSQPHQTIKYNNNKKDTFKNTNSVHTFPPPNQQPQPITKIKTAATAITSPSPTNFLLDYDEICTGFFSHIASNNYKNPLSSIVLDDDVDDDENDITATATATASFLPSTGMMNQQQQQQQQHKLNPSFLYPQHEANINNANLRVQKALFNDSMDDFSTIHNNNVNDPSSSEDKCNGKSSDKNIIQDLTSENNNNNHNYSLSDSNVVLKEKLAIVTNTDVIITPEKEEKKLHVVKHDDIRINKHKDQMGVVVTPEKEKEDKIPVSIESTPRNTLPQDNNNNMNVTTHLTSKANRLLKARRRRLRNEEQHQKQLSLINETEAVTTIQSSTINYESNKKIGNSTSAISRPNNIIATFKRNEVVQNENTIVRLQHISGENNTISSQSNINNVHPQLIPSLPSDKHVLAIQHTQHKSYSDGGNNPITIYNKNTSKYALKGSITLPLKISSSGTFSSAPEKRQTTSSPSCTTSDAFVSTPELQMAAAAVGNVYSPSRSSKIFKLRPPISTSSYMKIDSPKSMKSRLGYTSTSMEASAGTSQSHHPPKITSILSQETDATTSTVADHYHTAYNTNSFEDTYVSSDTTTTSGCNYVHDLNQHQYQQQKEEEQQQAYDFTDMFQNPGTNFVYTSSNIDTSHPRSTPTTRVSVIRTTTPSPCLGIVEEENLAIEIEYVEDDNDNYDSNYIYSNDPEEEGMIISASDQPAIMDSMEDDNVMQTSMSNTYQQQQQHKVSDNINNNNAIIQKEHKRTAKRKPKQNKYKINEGHSIAQFSKDWEDFPIFSNSISKLSSSDNDESTFDRNKDKEQNRRLLFASTTK